ncbi:TetR/AcrR family transcriptional regulator [Nocardia brasiliensis]|uniref:Transcriptional regulator n=1 Tax=Nocardia brasiliensis (strain ATCC 700358 / HUJEG-1) TaxID=1133849 RepID=K0F1H1_NOCB7|nr:TetR/AcrR family transcriptional regulator [Nocardia brasiliensis]AFU02970.1 transcriptional regulator [Nocardia brasiliensis ATCC 700358]OCF86040.1 transcriptional regulator [Nocardia brasiliensis]
MEMKPAPDGRALRYRHRRPELLRGATEFVLEHGIADLSLRAVAEALDVSHPTLLRHFTSKEALLLAILDALRTDLFAKPADVDALAQAQQTPADLVRALWRKLCEPAEQRQFHLLFQLVSPPGAIVQGSEELATSLVRDWVEMITERLVLDGWPRERAEPVATLVLAQFRGLQLDLLLTGDRERADRAVEESLRLLAPRSEQPGEMMGAPAS